MSCLRSGVGSYCRRKRTIGGELLGARNGNVGFLVTKRLLKKNHSGAEIFEGLQLLLHEIIGLKKIVD